MISSTQNVDRILKDKYVNKTGLDFEMKRIIANREYDELRLMSVDLVCTPSTAVTVIVKTCEWFKHIVKENTSLDNVEGSGLTQLLKGGLASSLCFVVAISVGELIM